MAALCVPSTIVPLWSMEWSTAGDGRVFYIRMGYLSIYNRPWGVVAMGDIENKTALDTIIEELRTVSAGNNCFACLSSFVAILLAMAACFKAV